LVYQGQVWLYVSNLARALSSQSSFLDRTLYHIKGCEYEQKEGNEGDAGIENRIIREYYLAWLWKGRGEGMGKEKREIERKRTKDEILNEFAEYL